MAEVPAHRRVDALTALAERYLPRLVPTDGEYDDWNVAGPALVALCTRQLEAVFNLPPPRHRVAAEILTRSLADYAITFAWLAAPEDAEGRKERMVRFARNEWLERGKADKRYTTSLPARDDRYRSLIEQGHMPSELLGPEARAKLEEIQQADGPKGMPPLIDRAIEADEVWPNEIPALATQPFAAIYASLYASLSMTAHASVSAADRLISGQPPRVLVGYAEPLGTDQGPYDIACSVVTIVLVIASKRLGWPPEDDIYTATQGGVPGPVVNFDRATPTDGEV